jgi:hypothetical protein
MTNDGLLVINSLILSEDEFKAYHCGPSNDLNDDPDDDSNDDSNDYPNDKLNDDHDNEPNNEPNDKFNDEPINDELNNNKSNNNEIIDDPDYSLDLLRNYMYGDNSLS